MKRTPKKATQQQVFLSSYALYGNIGLACDAAKVARARHSEWMRDDPDYRQAFEEAGEIAADRLTEEARRRAVEGVTEPVLYQGTLCFEQTAAGKRGKPIVTTRYSDNLLMFLIKKIRPEYREHWRGELQHSGAISSGPDLSALSDEQLHQLHQLAIAAGNGGGTAAVDALGEPGAEHLEEPDQ